MPPIGLPPLVIWALGAVGAAALARFVRHEWQRVNADLHPREEAPSDLAIIGRYVLTPDIFPCLAATKSDRTGEIQLTNGLRALLKSRAIYACEVKGVRHDTGNKLGFLKAVVYFALRRPDLAGKFSEYLRSIGLEVPAVNR